MHQPTPFTTPHKSLEGRIAVVTGGARGIGKAIASCFANHGALAVLTDIDEAGGAQAADTIGARFMKLDVREEADWARLIVDVPQADIVVNNAGITGFENGPAAHDPEFASLKDWRDVHATNLDGTFLGCRYAIAAMKGQGTGSIINMSSRSGLVGVPMASAYASSKAAIRNHTKSVALYCAGKGWKIRCNSLHPAAIMTPMWETMIGDGPGREERLAGFVTDTPLKRFGTVDEVAKAALFLAQDGSAYMTGSELNIDGGLLAGSAALPSPE